MTKHEHSDGAYLRDCPACNPRLKRPKSGKPPADLREVSAHDQLVLRAGKIMADRQIAAWGRITNPPDYKLLQILGDSDLQHIIDHHPAFR
jgi:hypothetical protein